MNHRLTFFVTVLWINNYYIYSKLIGKPFFQKWNFLQQSGYIIFNILNINHLLAAYSIELKKQHFVHLEFLKVQF